jgi:regulator of sigma E protease
MNILLLLFNFIIMIVPIILIHEMGHLIIGKILGAEPSRFSIGFGKLIQSVNYKNINFEFRLILLGGFVEFKKTQFPQLEQKESLNSPLKWILISFAGPFFNFLTFCLLVFSLQIVYFSSIKTQKIKKILTPHYLINENMIYLNSDYKISNLSADSEKYSFFSISGDNVVFSNSKEKINKDLFFSKILLDKEKSIPKIDLIMFSIKNSLYIFYEITKQHFVVFGKLFTGQLNVSDTFSGPIKTSQIIQNSISTGWFEFFYLFAILSFSIGFFNLIPFFAILDGGRIVLALIELISPIKLSKQAIIHFFNISFYLIVSFSVFTILLDIAKFIK